MIKVGAFDEFGDTRSTLLASFETIIDTINDTSRRTLKGQVTMFELGQNDENLDNIKYNFTKLPEYKEKEILAMEKEMMGIYISGHPLDKLREAIEKATTINSLQMLQIKEENKIEEDR